MEADAERNENNNQARGYQPPPRFRCACDRDIVSRSGPCGRTFLGRKFHRGEEAVSAPRERFHETGILGGVAQGVAQALDGRVQAMIEVYKRIGWPQAGVKIFPGNNFTGTLEKHGQDLQGLFLEANFDAVAAQLSRAKVYLKDSKADNSVCGISRHLADPDWGSLGNKRSHPGQSFPAGILSNTNK